jgi:hypothetical protein
VLRRIADARRADATSEKRYPVLEHPEPVADSTNSSEATTTNSWNRYRFSLARWLRRAMRLSLWTHPDESEIPRSEGIQDLAASRAPADLSLSFSIIGMAYEGFLKRHQEVAVGIGLGPGRSSARR